MYIFSRFLFSLFSLVDVPIFLRSKLEYSLYLERYILCSTFKRGSCLASIFHLFLCQGFINILNLTFFSQTFVTLIFTTYEIEPLRSFSDLFFKTNSWFMYHFSSKEREIRMSIFFTHTHTHTHRHIHTHTHTHTHTLELHVWYPNVLTLLMPFLFYSP